jgi:hypothetical protein
MMPSPQSLVYPSENAFTTQEEQVLVPDISAFVPFDYLKRYDSLIIGRTHQDQLWDATREFIKEVEYTLKLLREQEERNSNVTTNVKLEPSEEIKRLRTLHRHVAHLDEAMNIQGINERLRDEDERLRQSREQYQQQRPVSQYRPAQV